MIVQTQSKDFLLGVANTVKVSLKLLKPWFIKQLDYRTCWFHKICRKPQRNVLCHALLSCADTSYIHYDLIGDILYINYKVTKGI